MKIKKSYLQEIIKEELFRHLAKEELLKELMGPPKKPPTKIKPKAKPKPLEKSITFYYLLDDEQENSKLHEYVFTADQIKYLMSSAFNSGKDDEEKFLKLAENLVNLGDNRYSSAMSYSYIKDIIENIPELKNLTGLTYHAQNTFYGMSHPIFQNDRYEADPTDSSKKKVDFIPYIHPQVGEFKIGGNKYDKEKRARKVTEYGVSALLRGYWRYKIGANQEQYKSSLIDTYDIQKIKDYIKYLEFKREENKDNPEYVKNSTKSINDYKFTLQKSKKVDDKIEIKKEEYYHGFVPISLLVQGITRPSKDNPEEYEIIDATANYWNFKDAGFKEFKDIKNIGDKYVPESELKTKELTKDINSVLLSQKPKNIDLKFSRSDMKVKEKISKDEFLQRKTGQTPDEQDVEKDEQTPDEEDPISDFNQMLKGILPSSKQQQK